MATATPRTTPSKKKNEFIFYERNSKSIAKLAVAVRNTRTIQNLISKQAGMTTFRGVIEFVLFVASVSKTRFTFCLTAQNIQQLETTFFNKIDIRIPNYKHIPISTLITQLMNSSDYYLNK